MTDIPLRRCGEHVKHMDTLSSSGLRSPSRAIQRLFSDRIRSNETGCDQE